MKKIKVAIAGIGYVGLSISMLLAKKNDVVAFDINKHKVQELSNGISPLDDKEIQEYLNSHQKNNLEISGSFKATANALEAFKDATYVVIATPTNYDVETNSFETSSIEAVINDVISISPKSTIVIKSTVPIGYTNSIKKRFTKKNIIFSPEFLREGFALYDNLYPSRIIMGDHSEEAKKFAALLNEGAIKENIDSLFTDPEEAEAIKLFSNTYLAMRISYFNELDTYAEINGLNSKKIIEGIGLDSRIGLHYNNPSFGFGGYCLPKDTRQLKANFSNIPNKIIDSIYEANEIRKDFIANSVLSKNPKTVGIYRLVMKSGADNYRDSAMLGLINRIKDKKMTKIIIYEPQISNKISNDFLGCIIINDLKKFKGLSDIIIANRMNEELDDASNKIYTRDLFNIN